MNKTTTETQEELAIAALKPEIVEMLKLLIADIDDDCRSEGQDEADNDPSMDCTFATNNDFSVWAYQTGDNSYTGSCYSLPHWAVITLGQDSNAEEFANDIINQWQELTSWH